MLSAANIDWNLIRLLAARSALAYRQATISDAKTGAAVNVTTEMINGELAVIVAFRGSEDIKDFVQDAEAWFTDLYWAQNGETASVHHGFMEDFEAVNVAVVQSVRDILALSPNSKVFLTGHSLGGALAILCALEFSRQKLPVANVVTFGQPRAGNAVFRDIYDAALRDITFRVVNQNDIVPRLPGLLLGYRHGGQELFLTAGGGWALNPGNAAKLFSDACGLFAAWRKKGDVLVTEHFIAAYQQRIQLL